MLAAVRDRYSSSKVIGCDTDSEVAGKGAEAEAVIRLLERRGCNVLVIAFRSERPAPVEDVENLCIGDGLSLLVVT